MNENTRTSAEIGAGEIKVTLKSENKIKKYDTTDFIFTFIYAVLGWSYVRFFFFYDWSTNFDFLFPFYSIAYIAAVLSYAKAKGIPVSKECYFWIGVMLCIAFTIKLDRFFLLVIQSFVAAYFTSAAGGLYRGGSSAYLAADLWNTFLMKPIGNFFTVIAVFAGSIRNFIKKREKISVSPAVTGGLMAVAALTVIIPLLIEADSNFLSGTTDFMSHLLKDLFGDDFVNFLVTLFLAFPVTCYLYGLGYGSISCEPLFSAEDIDLTRNGLGTAVSATVKVFLYIICIVYIMFIALQAEYLLGAFTGKLYPGMTYAQYARTGFFELCKVSAINLSLLCAANLIIRKEEKAYIKKPVILLCILSLILLATALAKMIMYMTAYGLTEKRVVGTVFLLWLASVFVMCIVRLNNPFNLTKSALLTGAVMFCVLFSFDIGTHADNFNNKYGYRMKVRTETYVQTELRMPDKYNINTIGILHSTDSSYGYTLNNSEYCLNKMYDITDSAVLTDIPSVNDFPATEDYYIITFDSSLYRVDDTVTLYCYEKNDRFYLEQPYSGVWEIQENLPLQFAEHCF